MGGLKTLVPGLLCALLPLAAMAEARPSPADLARAFAECAGRYSALAEHRMLFDGPASDEALDRRDRFVTLLDAVLPDAGPVGDVTAMAWRVEAKAAHRRLLSAATFGTEAAGRGPAGQRAAAYIAACDRLILGA